MLLLCRRFHLLRHSGVGFDIGIQRNNKRLRDGFYSGRLVRQQLGSSPVRHPVPPASKPPSPPASAFCLQSIDLLLKTGFATLVDLQILLLHLLALLREVHIREAAHHSRQERFVRTTKVRSRRAEVVHQIRADQRRLLLGRDTSRRGKLLSVGQVRALLRPETALTEFRESLITRCIPA